jgi:DNA-nicking Smr family endonuclease
MPRSPPDDDDDDAFAEAMRGVRPLFERRPRVEVPSAAPLARAPAPLARAPVPAAPAHPFVVERAGDTISGRATDVSAKHLRELRRGLRAVEARVDLHGRAREPALRALARCILDTRARGGRIALVIHGRGRGSPDGDPVLRPAVWEWLQGAAAHRAGVMAFASARPADGGSGATVVWLRRA